MLLDYQAKVYLETFRGKPLTPSTQKSRITCVKSFYGYLVKNNLATYDPAADLDLPRLPKMLPRNVMSKKEMGQLLSAPNLETPLGIRDRAILELIYCTGIRAEELCSLTVQDLGSL